MGPLSARSPLRAAVAVARAPVRVIRALHLGETGPLSQGVQACRKAVRVRHINGAEVRKKRPRGFKKETQGVQVSPRTPLSVAPWMQLVHRCRTDFEETPVTGRQKVRPIHVNTLTRRGAIQCTARLSGTPTPTLEQRAAMTMSHAPGLPYQSRLSGTTRARSSMTLVARLSAMTSARVLPSCNSFMAENTPPASS